MTKKEHLKLIGRLLVYFLKALNKAIFKNILFVFFTVFYICLCLGHLHLFSVSDELDDYKRTLWYFFD